MMWIRPYGIQIIIVINHQSSLSLLYVLYFYYQLLHRPLLSSSRSPLSLTFCIERENVTRVYIYRTREREKETFFWGVVRRYAKREYETRDTRQGQIIWDTSATTSSNSNNNIFLSVWYRIQIGILPSRYFLLNRIWIGIWKLECCNSYHASFFSLPTSYDCSQSDTNTDTNTNTEKDKDKDTFNYEQRQVVMARI